MDKPRVDAHIVGRDYIGNTQYIALVVDAYGQTFAWFVWELPPIAALDVHGTEHARGHADSFTDAEAKAKESLVQVTQAKRL